MRADEIIFMESYGKYLIVHAKDQVYKVMERISHMQEILEPHGFFRIHRCILLNMHFIQRIQNDMVYCSTGDKLILSKKNRKSLMKAYGQYILGDGDRRD